MKFNIKKLNINNINILYFFYNSETRFKINNYIKMFKYKYHV